MSDSTPSKNVDIGKVYAWVRAQFGGHWPSTDVLACAFYDRCNTPETREEPSIRDLRSLLRARTSARASLYAANDLTAHGEENNAYEAAHGAVIDWCSDVDHLETLAAYLDAREGSGETPGRPMTDQEHEIALTHDEAAASCRTLDEIARLIGLPDDVELDASHVEAHIERVRGETKAHRELTDAEAGAVFMKSGIPKLIVEGVKIGPEHWFDYARAIVRYIQRRTQETVARTRRGDSGVTVVTYAVTWTIDVEAGSAGRGGSGSFDNPT